MARKKSVSSPPRLRREPATDPWRQRMRDARRAAAVTQMQLGALLGLTKTRVQYWESVGEPPLSMFPRIAEALGTTPEWLLFGVGSAHDEVDVETITRTIKKIAKTKAASLAGPVGATMLQLAGLELVEAVRANQRSVAA